MLDPVVDNSDLFPTGSKVRIAQGEAVDAVRNSLPAGRLRYTGVGPRCFTNYAQINCGFLHSRFKGRY